MSLQFNDMSNQARWNLQIQMWNKFPMNFKVGKNILYLN